MAKALYVDGNYILVMDRAEAAVVWALVNASETLEADDGTDIEVESRQIWEELNYFRNERLIDVIDLVKK